MTLFELLTLEGWTEIRDMFSGRNKMAEAVSDRHMNTKNMMKLVWKCCL